MAYSLRKSCPGCGRPSADAPVHMSATTPAEGLAPEALTSFSSGYGVERNFFTYYECPSCQLYFCRLFFEPEDLGRLYASQPENTGEASLAARARTQRGY